MRPTEPLTPEEQQKRFILPPGFEIQLVAAEPDISKPMNLAFDTRGRLWVTDSLEYPFPAPLDQKGRDTIRVLEDSDGDGRADKVTTFADGLNIPIGLYPYGDGVIVCSIPNLWYLRDTDGDGRCDVREKLYGPIGWERDTHGMCNAFTRGFDGWLYACHGFNNHTVLAGRDGHQITMTSGNTFRMRLDGSRVEHYTKGQVNPFGMSFDRNGDLFTADCHTKPVTLLLHNGCYESFGRPHDGTGFVPNVMDHLHGSTAIAGIAIWDLPGLPAEFRNNTCGGNVMTSRINRNSLVYTGSSIRAKEEPDLLVSADPWFRPVDLQVGPDGALYVADFYNRIIGHYEVPLQHPGRDRHRGRIWRIVYRGDASSAPLKRPDLTQAAISDLIQHLAAPVQSLRMLAADRLVDHYGAQAIEPVKACLQRKGLTEADNRQLGSVAKSTLELRRVHLLWVLMRLNAVTADMLESALQDEAAFVRQHACRVLAALPTGAVPATGLLQRAFADDDPLVRRSAVMAAAQHPAVELLAPLLALSEQTPAADVHLKHAVRLALRDHLAHDDWYDQIASLKLSSRQRELIADISTAVNGPKAAGFLVQRLFEIDPKDAGRTSELMRVAARNASGPQISELTKIARSRFANDIALQRELLESLRLGLEQRGGQNPDVRQWALDLASRWLTAGSAADEPLSWTFQPHPGTPDRGNPWTVQNRPLAGGVAAWPLHSSFPRGEQWTGILRSASFAAPETLSFYLCGHMGFPTSPPRPTNFVRLRDAVTHETLREVQPPRNDTAQKIEWNLKELNGRPVYVELVDGDTDSAYAWLAAGNFSLPGLNPSRLPEDRRQAALLVSRFKLTELAPSLSARLKSSVADPETARALAAALVSLKPDARRSALAEAIGLNGLPESLRQRLIHALTDETSAALDELLTALLQTATIAQQVVIAEQLTSDTAGTGLLVSLIEKGRASSSLLQRPTVAARLSAVRDPGLKERLESLMQNLPTEPESLALMIEQRRAVVLARPGTASIGLELFKKNCQACHQVAGQGQKVGPNLDGIGARGPDRLIEDILAPNRNVDVAFRATNVVTKEGQVINGLVRRSEGQQLVLVDGKGKELTIPLSDIDEQIPTKLSPMPAGFAEQVSEDDFRHLLAYLLTLRQADPVPESR